uniref:SAVED domain-containing protein n=1 Tax=Fervidobacterium pennivorans TaxID=93466 RepID=A0A7C4RXD0_FERPE
MAHLPVFVAISSKFSEKDVISSYEGFLKIVSEKYEVLPERVIYFKNEDLSENWEDELEKVTDFLNEQISKGGILHLSLMVPATFALALGMNLSRSQIPPMVVYHYQAGRYFPVVDLIDNPRKVKDISKSMENILLDFENEATSKECAILIQFASHSMKSSVAEFLKKNNTSCSMLEITDKSVGNLEIGDWSKEVSEVYKAIQDIRRENYIERFHFFMSAPISFAFVLGLSLGRYVPATIYQFIPSSQEIYKDVIKI